MSELQMWLVWGRVQARGNSAAGRGALLSSKVAASTGEVNGPQEERRCCGVWNPVGQGGLRAGRQLGDTASPSCEVGEVFPGPGVGRLSVKDQRTEEMKLRGPHRFYQNCRCRMKAAADGT